MNIIIAGDGEVGFHLARSLTELNHNITVVDPDQELLKRLERETDLLTIAGSSTSPRVLGEANVGDCDLFAAVLHEESINLMSCVVAKRMGAKRTVARITNAELLAPKHRDMFREVGVDELVCPERIAAKEITNLLNNSVATEFFDFSGGLLTMYLIRIDAESPVAGHSVQELVQLYSSLKARVVAILRGGETIIPHAGLVFQHGDLAYIISRPNQREALQRAVGKEDVAQEYIAKAKEMATFWTRNAMSSSGGVHYLLNFGSNASTWSTKYNMVWDKAWGWDLFRIPRVREMAFYTNKMTTYGLPLDSRGNLVKNDWHMWAAAMADSKTVLARYINPMWKFINECPTRVPITDGHDGGNASKRFFQARSVVGGYWMRVFVDKFLAGELTPDGVLLPGQTATTGLDRWFDLSGRQVPADKARNGIYIHEGKKVRR